MNQARQQLLSGLFFKLLINLRKMPYFTYSKTDEADQPALSVNGWDNILQKTTNLKTPCIQQQVLNEAETADFNRWITDSIKFNCLKNKYCSDFLIYQNGETASLSFIQQNLLPAVLNFDNDPLKWIGDVFAENQFSIVMNHIEKYSTQTAEKLSEMINPLLLRLGIPSKGIHTTVNIDNQYFTQKTEQYTQTNALRFNLSEADQFIYTWPAEIYKAAGGAAQPSAELLSLAVQHHFKKGDLIFIPEDHYYFKRAAGISVSLILWFDNDQQKALFEKTQTDVVSDYTAALFSNRGWMEIPLTIDQISDFKPEENFYQLKNKQVQLPYPFKIYHKVLNSGELAVYARGAKITLKYHPLLPEILDWLNTNEVIPTNSLLLELNRKWPEEAGLYFLALLYNKRAVYLLS